MTPEVEAGARETGSTAGGSEIGAPGFRHPEICGVVLAAGLGLTAPMVVAVGLSLAGLVILLASFALERKTAAA